MNAFALYVILASISPLIASIFPIIIQQKEGSIHGVSLILLGISSGMLFAVATIDLIPEAFQFALSSAEDFADDNNVYDEHHLDHAIEENIKLASIGIFIGFTLLFVIQQIISMKGGGHSHSTNDLKSGHSHSHPEGDTNNDAVPFLHTQNYAALVGLTIHSFIDGVMISGAFSASSDVGMRVGIAIVLHKFPDGFVLSSLLQSGKSKHSKRTQPSKMGWFLFICSMTTVGAILSSLIFGELPKNFMGFILGLGAGSFLFITCVVILPELIESKHKITGLVSFIIGYISFLTTDTLLHAH